jgi:hypothetical protein
MHSICFQPADFKSPHLQSTCGASCADTKCPMQQHLLTFWDLSRPDMFGTSLVHVVGSMPCIGAYQLIQSLYAKLVAWGTTI